MHAVLRKCHKAPLIYFLRSKQHTPLSRIWKELDSEEGKNHLYFWWVIISTLITEAGKKKDRTTIFVSKTFFFLGGGGGGDFHKDRIQTKKNPPFT